MRIDEAVNARSEEYLLARELPPMRIGRRRHQLLLYRAQHGGVGVPCELLFAFGGLSHMPNMPRDDLDPSTPYGMLRSRPIEFLDLHNTSIGWVVVETEPEYYLSNGPCVNAFVQVDLGHLVPPDVLRHLLGASGGSIGSYLPLGARGRQHVPTPGCAQGSSQSQSQSQPQEGAYEAIVAFGHQLVCSSEKDVYVLLVDALLDHYRRTLAERGLPVKEQPGDAPTLPSHPVPPIAQTSSIYSPNQHSSLTFATEPTSDTRRDPSADTSVQFTAGTSRQGTSGEWVGYTSNWGAESGEREDPGVVVRVEGARIWRHLARASGEMNALQFFAVYDDRSLIS